MEISLAGKNAVICGSTQGIGLAIAKAFVLVGARCTLLARNQNRLQQLVKEFNEISSETHLYEVADFSDPASVEKAIQKITQANKYQILVNNTGGPKAGPITEAVPTDFTTAFQQHLVNNHLLTQAVLPAMKEAQYGRIINIVSTSVRVPLPNLGVSNTIRAAVAGWAKTLSNEVAAYNITVNNILPGLISTQRLESVTQHTMAQQNITAQQATEALLQTVPMHRFGAPEEIAALASFLASPLAGYITGTSIPVDGGRTGTI